MQKIAQISILAFALLIAGCKTSPQNVAYQSVGSIAISVAAARDAYFEYRDSNPGKVPPALDDKIKALYLTYQQSALIAEAAERLALKSGLAPDANAMQAVTVDSQKLITAIAIANPNQK